MQLPANVLYVSSVDLSLPNGPGVNEREFVRSLRDRLGDQLHVLVPRPASPVPETDGEEVTLCRPHGGYRPFRYLRHQIDLYRAGRRLLAERSFDLVVFRVTLFPLAFLALVVASGVPCAVKTLGGNPLRTRRKGIPWLVAPLAWLDDRVVGALARRAVAVDACTEALINRARTELRVDPASLLLVENATNVDRFAPMDRTQARAAAGVDGLDPVIGFVGGKPWERGAMEMLEMLPLLSRTHPQVGAVVVGGGDGMSALVARADALGVSDRCVFTGVIPYDQVPTFVNAFDLCIAFERPQLTAGVGNSYQKIRQYLACGKPVLATGGGGLDLEGLGLGTTVTDLTETAALAEAARVWLSLTAAERETHSARASGYARLHLSTAATLAQRLGHWAGGLRRARGLAAPGARAEVV